MKHRSLVTGIIGLLLVSLLLFQPYKLVVVVGRSMLPTLKGGQILLAKKTNKFERGDIVVIKEEDNIIIKRIKYLPEEYYYSVLDFETAEMIVIENDFRDMMLGIEKYGLENIKEYKKQYYHQTKEQKNKKITCICGSETTQGNKPKHERTRKHQAFITIK